MHSKLSALSNSLSNLRFNSSVLVKNVNVEIKEKEASKYFPSIHHHRSTEAAAAVAEAAAAPVSFNSHSHS